MNKIAMAAVMVLAGCNANTPSNPAQPVADPSNAQGIADSMPVAALEYRPPATQRVVSVYVDPPLVQPEPVRVEWAPPPMLMDEPPPQPSGDQVWTGGYWVWEGDWVWAHGRWSSPPRPGYHWNNPYYEHRDHSVIFVDGFWSAPDVAFVAPRSNMTIALGIVAVGVVAGMHAEGPEGVFVPAPPGSHYGLIVPAPVGTAPAVVSGSPPVIRTGMRITGNRANITVVAPANSTATGKSVNMSVPGQPHLAAAQTPIVKVMAPTPESPNAIPAHTPDRPPPALPAARQVHPVVPPALVQAHAAPTHDIAPNQVIDKPVHEKPDERAVQRSVTPDQPPTAPVQRAIPVAVPQPEMQTHARDAAPASKETPPHLTHAQDKPVEKTETRAVKEIPAIPVKTPVAPVAIPEKQHENMPPEKPEEKSPDKNEHQ